ncbi:hypothetical protein COLO4_27837 [Corchorus olitorius]|uniref:Uncharacterized protein n=1 Tax=Corchorus olitorius TaxID=93759 RepID=A0A1R3HPJ8_9ROSI|nr:hypothetical protein COLO4_27837 [Corchorus olitorius]
MSRNVQAWSLNNETKLEGSIVSRVSMSGTPSDLELLKSSACIFKSQSNRTIPVSPGPKFVRLHFYPISSSSLNISKALFNVSIGSYTLLSASESSYSKGAFDFEYIIKEYCVPVDGNVLNILFTPSLGYSDAYGFVNMIEVVSVPPKLYLGDMQLPLINGHPNQFYSMKSRALETLYRVNVGGPDISAGHDTAGMSRSWSGDKGNLDQNIDPFLLGQISPDCLETFTSIASKCLADKGSDRPSMGEVLCNLELAWKQEQRSFSLVHGRANVCVDGNLPPVIDGQRCLPACNSDRTPGVEFSDIMFPTGR